MDGEDTHTEWHFDYVRDCFDAHECECNYRHDRDGCPAQFLD